MIFNRPLETEQVLNAIARARPDRLLVIADGPRPHHPADADNCAAARAVIDRVDWDCEVFKNYSDTNLGVGARPATGLRWVFETVEEAIIFEDDCVPHPTFFRYCEELLDTYRDDERVMHIGGSNWHFTPNGRPHSYYFSCYSHNCGWATWRRAFTHYDPQLKLWPYLRDTPWILDIVGDPKEADFWRVKFDMIYNDGVEKHGWDWPWLFACWAHRGLSILPTSNFITNIGFGEDATHTTARNDVRANIAVTEMGFPLIHPPCMMRDIKADRLLIEQQGFQSETLYQEVRRRCVTALPPNVKQSLSSLRSLFVRP